MSDRRIHEGIKDVRFERQSILSTIRLSGQQVPLTFEGTLNKEIFAGYVRNQLAPTLDSDDTLVMDNSSVHKSKLVRETLDELGIKVLFLPSYSPDFNPIELMWAYVKAILRKLKARTSETLIPALGYALSCVSQSLIAAWFLHCGFGL